jgi:heat shock protein HtpX
MPEVAIFPSSEPNAFATGMRRDGALERLLRAKDGSALPEGMAAFGIRGGSAFARIFSTHPPLEDRIAAMRGASVAGGR